MFCNWLQKISALIEAVFPKRADAALIDSVHEDILLQQRALRHYEGCQYLLEFQHPVVRAGVHELKFHQNQKALQMLSLVLREHIKQSAGPITIIPIPLSKKRRRERGYNQTELLVQGLSSLSHVCIATNILTKPVDTLPQTTLKRAERLSNVRQAFAVRRQTAAKIADAHIILIDDVTTTGATLQAAKATLLPHAPASVTCLAMAH